MLQALSPSHQCSVALVLLHVVELHLSVLGTLQGLVSSPTQGERQPVVKGQRLVPGQGVGSHDAGAHHIGRPLGPSLDGIFQIFNVVTVGLAVTGPSRLKHGSVV